jgi:hypothetical protein
MRKFYYIFLVLFIIKNGTAQSVDTIYEQVYFDFDKYDLTTSEQNKLDAITLKGTLLQVYIEANTDARGSNDYNLRLGANRASTVSDYLNTKGIQPEVLKIINHGEARPIAFKEEETAFAKNRRVDIIIIYQEKQPETVQDIPEILHPVIPQDTNDIMDIYKELAIAPEVFIIKKQDTIIKSKRGTVLVINKKDINCSCKKDAAAIRIELKEAYKTSEMVRERLVTMDSQNRLLESGGMLNLKIFCKNKPTWLSKPIEIIVPTDKYLDGMRLYNTVNRTEKLTTTNGFMERKKMLWEPQQVLTNYDDWLNRKGGCGNYDGYDNITKNRFQFILWCKRQIRNIRYFFESRRSKRAKKKKLKESEAILKQNNSINNVVKNVRQTKEAARFYVLETRTLGWMNLDRLRPTKGPLVQMTIEGKVEKSSDIMVVMEDFQSIYDPIYEENPYLFTLEKGGRATVVALKFTDEGDFLLAFQKASSKKPTVKLEFQKYSIKEIKKKLKSLDR